MRAVVRIEYGDTRVLRVDETEEPVPGEGQVLVRVAAAGVNMAEWHLTTGEPRVMRVAVGLTRPRKPGLGADVAGVVAAVGAGVSRFAVGDRVFGSGMSTWAELCLARAELLQPVPTGVSLEEAAAVPMAGYTALRALAAAGELEGRRVAVTGAGGGVGSLVVQLAKSRGAHVTAVCSARKADFVRLLGADDVIDYATTDPTAASVRFDAVLDFAGGLPVTRWRGALVPRGVLVLGGAENGGPLIGPLARSFRGLLTRGIKVVTLVAVENAADIAELARLLASGRLRSPVARSYPLAEAAQAVDDLRAATHPGKLVLTP